MLVQPTDPPDSAPHVNRIDGTLRMALWVIVFILAARDFSANGTAPVSAYGLPFLSLTVLLSAFLLASTLSAGARLRQFGVETPMGAAFVPVVLVLPYVLFARNQPDFDPARAMNVAMLLFLPTAAQLLEDGPTRGSDIVLGLVMTALPLSRLPNYSPANLTSRALVFALAVALLLLSQEMRRRRSFFFYGCAVLAIGSSIVFGAFPDFPLRDSWPDYFQLAAATTGLYALALSGHYDDVAWEVRFSVKDAAWTIAGTAAMTAALTVAWRLGVLDGAMQRRAAWPAGGWAGIASEWAKSLVFYAFPAEILFRGALMRFGIHRLGWPAWAGIAISAVLYAGAAAWAGPGTFLFAGLALGAGLVYGALAYKTNNVTAAAAVSSLAICVMKILFPA